MSEFIVIGQRAEDGIAIDFSKPAVGELVRCKDCKFWRKYSSKIGTAMFCDHDCSLGGQGIKKPTDYCNYGEREEQEHE